jgi:hypothetical protein
MNRAAASGVTEAVAVVLVREGVEAKAKLAGEGLDLATPDLAAGLAVGTAADLEVAAAEVELALVVVGLEEGAATAKEEVMEAAAMAVAAVTAAEQKRH